MAERHFNEVVIERFHPDPFRVEFHDEQGVVTALSSNVSPVIVGRNGRKALGIEALTPGTRANIIESPKGGHTDLFIQVLGLEGAALIDQEKVVPVTPDLVDRLIRMKGQIDRVQHNTRALAFLKSLHGSDESHLSDYRSSVIFKVERGSSLEEGKAASPLLLTTVRRMLPEIVERTIQYAEEGNREALAEIAEFAEALKD